MIGGMICPPVEAVASTPAAKCGGKPERFISGIEIGPSTITLATALPEIVPNRLELIDRDLAGAAGGVAGQAMAKSMNNWPAPVRSMKLPNTTKMSTNDADTESAWPKMPSVVM